MTASAPANRRYDRDRRHDVAADAEGRRKGHVRHDAKVAIRAEVTTHDHACRNPSPTARPLRALVFCPVRVQGQSLP